MSPQVSFLPHVACVFPDLTFADPKYNKTFLMTYKSFATTTEVFDLLVARFWMQPPEKLAPPDLEEWERSKQRVVRVRFVFSRSLLAYAQHRRQCPEYPQVDDRRQ
jgi:hypothetical protein